MRNVFVILLVCLLAAIVTAGQLSEKWVQVSPNFADDSSVDYAISVLQTAKTAGVTHVTFRDIRFGFIDLMGQHYVDNCTRFKQAAEDLGIAIVPGVMPIGYSLTYLATDANLSAGLPVKNAPFIASSGVARPDPAARPAILNAGFDTLIGDAPLQVPENWTIDASVASHVKADATIKHSGAASLCEFDLGNLPPESAGNCIVTQKMKVKPYQYYHLSMWVRTENFSADEFRLFIRSHKGQRDHCYTSLPISWWQDWTQCDVTFNTLDTTEISIGLGAETCYSGTIWWDDLSIEPAGLANVLRGSTKPLKVTGAHGRRYVEGVDFETVVDPVVGHIPSGDPTIPAVPYDAWHQGPDIVLTAPTRIREGEKLKVSYYHPHLVYSSQYSVSTEDPAVFDAMDSQMQKVHEIFGASAYFLAYDEIRVAGWELQPGGKHLSAGAILSNHVKRAVGIVHKYAPDAKIYVWSDMFDPYHNACKIRPGGYYLARTDFWGSWRKLPKSVGIVNWIGRHDSMAFFGRRGHEQIMAGYYDSDPVSNVAMWQTAAKGVPNVTGMMYTQWGSGYDNLIPFFQIVDTVDWGN